MVQKSGKGRLNWIKDHSLITHKASVYHALEAQPFYLRDPDPVTYNFLNYQKYEEDIRTEELI